MREKTMKLVVTFPFTSAAMAMEKYCKESQAPGRLIPVPRAITAGCGMAWMALPGERPLLEQVIRDHGVTAEGWYELML